MSAGLLAVAAHWQLLVWPSPVPPVIDGRIDEAAWQELPAYEDFHQVLPEAGLAAPFATKVRLARDAEQLYIAIELSDPPEGPRASHSARRDRIPSTDDSLTLTIDPLGTRVFGQVFMVNPDCSIADGLYKEASLSIDFSPDFLHEAACQQHDQGWAVEYRIPLQELRFARGNKAPWSFLVQRSLIRDRLRTLANAPLPRDPLCLLCLAPSLDGIGVLPETRYLRVTPYALVRQRDLDPGDAKNRFQSGVDFKYRSSPESIFDATIQPDFSQISLDEPQLSANTQFAVAYPENRPFFLEGADILDTPLKAVATRSIQQPSWGLKWTHRSLTQDSMLLVGDDQTQNAILVPGPYNSRVRPIETKQKFLIGSTHWKGQGYNLGLTVTHRAYEELGANQSLAFDGMHYLTPESSLRWQSIVTSSSNRWDSEEEAFRSASLQTGAAHFLLLQHKGPRLRSSLELKSFTDDFRSDLGFNPRNAYRLGILTQGYHWALAERSIEPYLRLTHKMDLHERPMQRQRAPGVQLGGWFGLDLSLETRPQTEERIRANGPLHRYSQNFASATAYPGGVFSYLQCDVTFGERLDVRDDRVRPGRTDGCTIRLAPLKTVELTSRFSEEVLPDVLKNQTQNHLLVIPLSAAWSLRYIHQEERIKRQNEARRLIQTDSWNLGWERSGIFSVQVGATHESTHATHARNSMNTM